MRRNRDGACSQCVDKNATHAPEQYRSGESEKHRNNRDPIGLHERAKWGSEMRLIEANPPSVRIDVIGLLDDVSSEEPRDIAARSIFQSIRPCPLLTFCGIDERHLPLKRKARGQ